MPVLSFKKSSRDVDCLVIEQADASSLQSGGIDTIISDFIRYGTDTSFAIVGGTYDLRQRIGLWTQVEIGGRSVDFLPVFRMGASPRGLRRIPDSLRLALGVLRFVRRLPEGFVHVHRVELGALARTLRRDYSQFIHNDSAGLLGPNSDSFWRRLPRLYRFFERRAIGGAHSVSIFNKTDSERLKSMRSDVFVTETWFDPAIFELTSDPAGEALEICWVGRLESQKDPQLALDTLQELIRLDRNVHLNVVGDGSLAEELKSYAHKHELSPYVTFHGSVTRAEVGELMGSCAMLLMTSHYEGSPTVLVEAAAVGLAVVATLGSDPDGVVSPGRTGFINDTRAAKELAESVLMMRTHSRLDCRASVEYRSGPLLVKAILDRTLRR